MSLFFSWRQRANRVILTATRRPGKRKSNRMLLTVARSILSKPLPALLALCLLISMAVSVEAVTTDRGKRVEISNLHRLQGDFYALGGTIIIDGYVGGDLFALGQDYTCDGEVGGSANVWAESFHHRGKTVGSLRAGGMRVLVDGFVGRSLMAIGNEIRIGPRATIRRDVYALGNRTNLAGTVMGNLTVRGGRIDISGQIDGDVHLECEHISIVPPAAIKGNVTYPPDVASIEIDSVGGVTILGSVSVQEPEPAELEQEETEETLRSVVITASKMLAAFLFGVILIYVFGRYARQTCLELRARPTVSLAAGLLAVLVCLVSVVILLLSLTFLAIGVLMVGGENSFLGAIMVIFSITMIPVTGFAGISGAILLYTGKITLAMLIGYLLVRMVKSHPATMSKTQLFLGLIVITAAISIPWVGTVLWVLASIIGAGAIVLGIRSCRPGPEGSTELSGPAPPPVSPPPPRRQ